MPRDNEHNIYKEKWACFTCRKCFKQRCDWDLLADRGWAGGKLGMVKRVIRCPQCRREMTNMGWDFKVPKQKDIEQWRKAELLVKNGFAFHARYRPESQDRRGPGYRPRRLREVKEFLEKSKAQNGHRQHITDGQECDRSSRIG